VETHGKNRHDNSSTTHTRQSEQEALAYNHLPPR
jgi:hypothetical protein